MVLDLASTIGDTIIGDTTIGDIIPTDSIIGTIEIIGGLVLFGTHIKIT
jgi:hypothetical protein